MYSLDYVCMTLYVVVYLLHMYSRLVSRSQIAFSLAISTALHAGPNTKEEKSVWLYARL